MVILYINRAAVGYTSLNFNRKMTSVRTQLTPNREFQRKYIIPMQIADHGMRLKRKHMNFFFSIKNDQIKMT